RAQGERRCDDGLGDGDPAQCDVAQPEGGRLRRDGQARRADGQHGGEPAGEIVLLLRAHRRRALGFALSYCFLEVAGMEDSRFDNMSRRELQAYYAQQFPEMPARIRTVLQHVRIRIPAEAAALSDEDWLSLRNFGVTSLAVLRAAYGYAPPPVERSPVRCLACGGELPP